MPGLLTEHTFSCYRLELLAVNDSFGDCLADSLLVSKSLLVVHLDFLEHCPSLP